MNEKNKFVKAIKHPEWLFGVILRRLFAKVLDDKTFIKLEYFSGMRKFPNLDNPTTYNEKLIWLNLHDKHDETGQVSVPGRVRRFASGLCGELVSIND